MYQKPSPDQQEQVLKAIQAMSPGFHEAYTRGISNFNTRAMELGISPGVMYELQPELIYLASQVVFGLVRTSEEVRNANQD